MHWAGCATAIALLLAANPAAYAEQTGSGQDQAKTAEQSQQQAIEPVASGNEPVVLAEAIKGMTVIGANGEQLGSLDEIAVGLGGRSPGYALVMPAATGVGVIAVPFEALVLARNPGIAVGEGRQAERLSVARDDLIGQDVLNNRGTEIGEVDDIVLRRGEVEPIVVMDVGGFLGLGEKQIALPLADFSLFDDSLVLATDMTEEDFEAAPEFDPSDGEPIDPSKNIANLRRLEQSREGTSPGHQARAIDLAGTVLAVRMTADQFQSAPTLQYTSDAWQGDPGFDDEVASFFGQGGSGGETRSGDQSSQPSGDQNN
jgi:sporulation protein YlmC with PRC-barrel domain